MTGDNEELIELARKYLETYTLDELLELTGLDELDVVCVLLSEGLIDDDLPTVI